MNTSSKTFYDDGLRFGCSRCSLCCRFDSGYVWLSRADLDRLAERFRSDRRGVIDQYCRTVDIGGFRQLSLLEQPNRDCVFWVGGACSVYEHRPLQCRSYPFWLHHLVSREEWDRAAQHCPGVGVGPLHSRETIDAWLALRRAEPTLDGDSDGDLVGR